MKTVEAVPALEFLRVTRELFEKYKQMGNNTFAQLTAEEWHAQPHSQDNSIAILVQHIAGNLRSRFTDFLTTDGEKQDRKRDAEFEEQNLNGQQLEAAWEEAFGLVKQSISEIQEGDLSRIVFIRSEPHSVPEALLRSLAHISYHVGQIVYIAKSLKGDAWQTLSIPKGQSEAFNKAMQEQMEKEE